MIRAADLAQMAAVEAANAHVARCQECRADRDDDLPILCDVIEAIFAPAAAALERAWLEDL